MGKMREINFELNMILLLKLNWQALKGDKIYCSDCYEKL